MEILPSGTTKLRALIDLLQLNGSSEREIWHQFLSPGAATRKVRASERESVQMEAFPSLLKSIAFWSTHKTVTTVMIAFQL